MVSGEFNEIVRQRVICIQNTLASKAKEYASGGDRLHNFKVAARMADKSPAEALQGMMLKHLVSVFDLIDGRLENTGAMVNEKIGDTINYLILLEAVLAEARTEAVNKLIARGGEITPDELIDIAVNGIVKAAQRDDPAQEVPDMYKLPTTGARMKKPPVDTGVPQEGPVQDKATMRKLMPYA